MNQVYQTAKGYATLEWEGMYMIHFADGRILYTNSMDIVKEELKVDEQLNLFSQVVD